MSESHRKEAPESPARTDAVVNWGHVQEFGYPRAERIRLGLEPIPVSAAPNMTSPLESPPETRAADVLTQMHGLLAAHRVSEGQPANQFDGAEHAFPAHDGTTSAANGWNSEAGIAIGGWGGDSFDAGDH